MDMSKSKEIYMAGGCFWGTEHYLKKINGVIDTEVGFANGNTPDPTYREVYTDGTGYAETVRVRYDPEIISLRFLVELFFKAIDPLSVNRQGEDEGTRYRTGIYFTDESDRPTVDEVFGRVGTELGKDVVVECCPLKNFYPAEEYHQDYLDKNPHGYCHLSRELFEFAGKANGKKVG